MNATPWLDTLVGDDPSRFVNTCRDDRKRPLLIEWIDSSAHRLRRGRCATYGTYKVCPRCPSHSGAASRQGRQLSCFGPDGIRFPEVCLGPAAVGKRPILAEVCRRSCRVCHCAAGGTLGAWTGRACCALECVGSPHLQRSPGQIDR